MKKITNQIALMLLASAVFFSCSVERNSITRGGAGYGIGSSVASSNKSKQVKAMASDEVAVVAETPAVSNNESTVAVSEEKLETVINENVAQETKSSARLIRSNIKSASPTQKAEQMMAEKSVKKSPVAKAEKMTTAKTMGDGGGWGIASLACGVLGLLFLPILFGPLAIIFGALGLKKKLKGLAIAGLVLGVISLVVIFLLIGILLAVA
jgi:hypothetical protein